MKSNKYEPRVCEICGVMFKPGRIDQRTCASAECVRERKRLCASKKQGVYRARKREYMRRKRKPESHKPKPDTIVAIGYAERQKAKTLEMAGKVRTEV